MHHSKLFAGLAVAILMHSSMSLAQEENDPLEPVNRVVFRFNRVVDQNVLKPVSDFYGRVVPEVARQGIRNVLDNINEPVVFINCVLQGNTDRAGVALGRFMINTIFGLGLFDVATEAGFAKPYEDFGQTLGVWGAGEGPYLVLPIFGPSNVRDASGLAVDGLVFNPLGPFNPIGMEIPWGARFARGVIDGIDTRYRYGTAIDDIYNNSLDPYATFRTVYRQRRAAQIRNTEGAQESEQDYDAIFKEEQVQ